MFVIALGNVRDELSHFSQNFLEMSNEKSCITENDDGFLSSDFTSHFTVYSKYNLLRLQGKVDALTQIGCETAVFEPQYLMDLVENFKEKLPNDFYLKICALLKLYNEEKECLEKHIAKMKKRLDEAAKPLNRQLFYQEEVMPPYIITEEASASTSSNAGVLPIVSLTDLEIQSRTKQTPWAPNIQGGIRSLEVRFLRGEGAISEFICHCVCEKLRYINNRWEIDIVPYNEAHYSGIPRENLWLLRYKFDEEEEAENNEERLEKRTKAEIELGLRNRAFGNNWMGNEIVLIFNPV